MTTWQRYRNVLAVIGILVAFSLKQAHAQIQLLTNGGFESGTLVGWTRADQHNPTDTLFEDHFTISTPGANTPPVDGISFPTATNPSGGQFYAVTVSDHPGAHALLQNFTVPSTATSVSLAFQMFVDDQSGIGPIVDPSGLDYTTGGAFRDNQHARVDLLTATAGDLSTASSDVLSTFYLGVDAGAPPNPYTNYNFNLTSLVLPGQSYRLRFAEVDNDSAITLGVDNVSLLATAAPPAVPEPDPPTVVGALSLLCAFICRRRRRRNLLKISW